MDFFNLLPLNRPRRLAGDVVDDAVDAADLAHDAAGDAAEDVVGEWGPVGGHAVFGLDGADGAGVGVGALVAHDADRFYGEQHGEALPELAIEAGALDLFDADGVRLLENSHAVRGDLAKDADREPRAGEGLALEDLVGHLEVGTDAADLVFEEVAEGFDQFQFHVRGEAADVVVGLDDVARAVDAGGLDDVGVEGALYEPGYFFAR